MHCLAATFRGAPPHGRPGMTIQSGNADYPHVAEVRHLRRYRVRRVATTIVAAFGTVIWGWGKYIGWWSFSCLLVWALFAARDARRDSSRASLVLPEEPAIIRSVNHPNGVMSAQPSRPGSSYHSSRAEPRGANVQKLTP
jgi:hypothetical protein